MERGTVPSFHGIDLYYRRNLRGVYRTKALAIVSTMAGAAVAIGPLFGGVVTTFFSWRFGFGFELIIIAFVLIQYPKIKDFPAPPHERGNYRKERGHAPLFNI